MRQVSKHTISFIEEKIKEAKRVFRQNQIDGETKFRSEEECIALALWNMVLHSLGKDDEGNLVDGYLVFVTLDEYSDLMIMRGEMWK